MNKDKLKALYHKFLMKLKKNTCQNSGPMI